MPGKPRKGYFYKTAQDRESYEIDADSEFVYRLANVLVSRFSFQAEGKPLDGIDVVYWDFTRDGLRLIVGWDIWSGCFVFATTPEGDQVVQEIGQYLEGVLHEL